MATKRMFSNKTLDNDVFDELTPAAKALYFLLGMSVDDDGITDKVKRIAKTIPATNGEIKELTDAELIIMFPSGKAAITHHNENNNRLHKSKYTPSIHTEELSQLGIKNKVYFKLDKKAKTSTRRQDDVKKTRRVEQSRVEQNRVEKSNNEFTKVNSVGQENKFSATTPRVSFPFKKIIDYLNEKAMTSFKHTTRKTQALIKARFNEGFKDEDFISVIDNKTESWLTDPKMLQFLRPETLFGTKFESYLNAGGGRYKDGDPVPF